MSESALSNPAANCGEHPRPQQQRKNWTSLNGTWDFYIDPRAELARPEQVKWDRTILVPFSPETRASGIGEPGFYSAVWYRRDFEVAQLDTEGVFCCTLRPSITRRPSG